MKKLVLILLFFLFSFNFIGNVSYAEVINNKINKVKEYKLEDELVKIKEIFLELKNRYIYILTKYENLKKYNTYLEETLLSVTGNLSKINKELLLEKEKNKQCSKGKIEEIKNKFEKFIKEL